MFKKSHILIVSSCLFFVSQVTPLDQQKADKLLSYYIKNDDDQFSELLHEVAASSKDQAELYNDLAALSAKFTDFGTFYTKKQEKRSMRGRKSLTNALFYTIAGALSVGLGGMHYVAEKDTTTQAISAGASAAITLLCAWFAHSNLTSSIIDYNFFAKLLRKNKKFLAIVEKLKQAASLQMEVQIPVAEGVRLAVQ